MIRRALLFDLDDTLYPYRAFVRSGFREVATQLSTTRGLPARSVLRALRHALVGGARGRELQALCERFGLPQSVIRDGTDIIRAHEPRLHLPLETRRMLAALRSSWRLGVVTNGSPAIQQRKIQALGLAPLVDTVVFAREHGHGHGKPEPTPFLVALNRLGVTADLAVFVGDDLATDMAGAAALGLATIHADRYRLQAGHCASTRCDAHVSSLAQVGEVAAALLMRTTRYAA